MLALFLAALLAAVPVSAQAPAAVQGTVTDASGAAVPGVTVHLINPANNSDRTATTDAQGKYSLPAVAPGSYHLRIDAPGFEQYNADVSVSSGTSSAPTIFDVKLTVQRVQENVTVRSTLGDQCLSPQGRIFPDVGPGLREIRTGPDGNYYVLTAPGKVTIYSPDGKRLGQIPAAAPSIAARPSSVVGASDFQVDSDGNVYFADASANAIKIFSPEGTLTRTIRVISPISVEPLPGGEVAVASPASKHLVDVYDEERGEVFRSFGDLAPVVIECDASSLVCHEPEKKPTQPGINRVWFYGDADGDVYVNLADTASPTFRKYDAYGYLGYESVFPLSVLNRPATARSNWGLSADARADSLSTPDVTTDVSSQAASSNSSKSSSSGDATDISAPSGSGPALAGVANHDIRGAGGGGVNGNPGAGDGSGLSMGSGTLAFGIQIGQHDPGPLVLKPAIETMAVDAATQDVWASIAGTLVHFDETGQLENYYCLSAVDQAAVKPVTMLVEPNRLLIGRDPFGIFVYARPDKPAAASH